MPEISDVSRAEANAWWSAYGEKVCRARLGPLATAVFKEARNIVPTRPDIRLWFLRCVSDWILWEIYDCVKEAFPEQFGKTKISEFYKFETELRLKHWQERDARQLRINALKEANQ